MSRVNANERALQVLKYCARYPRVIAAIDREFGVSTRCAVDDLQRAGHVEASRSALGVRMVQTTQKGALFALELMRKDRGTDSK